MITIGKIAEWILANRRGRAFRHYSLIKIIYELDDCQILCVTDSSGIVGVVCAKEEEPKVLYIHDILTTKREALGKMIKHFLENFRGYTLKGKRHGKIVTIKNPEKIYNKLAAYGK